MMIWILLFIFLILLVFPLIYAIGIYKKYEGGILNINQSRTRDPRYFGKSFSKMMRRELKDGPREKYLKLSKKEEVHYTNQEEFKENRCDNLVVAEEEVFISPINMEFSKEIYAEKNACITENTLLRSIYSEENTILGSQTQVIRWADANGTMAIYDNCHLGLSTTSASMMSIGKNCTFHRLYAPVILLGQYPDELMKEPSIIDRKAYQLKVQKKYRKNISYIKDDMVDKDGVVPFTVTTKNDLVVTENLILQGSIRSAKGVRLCDGAVVCGNIFAEQDIILGKNTIVLGNVFTQGSIKIQDGGIIGRKENISSVVARKNIVIEKRACVYGYIGCEEVGKVWPLMAKENEKRNKRMTFLVNDRLIEEVTFATKEDYDNVNELGYRHCHSLKKVIIPKGVEKINRSMFYDCINVEEVILPRTLEIIEEYAFAGCKKLKYINIEKLDNLKEIKSHSFEGCKALEGITLPRSIETIENAAFTDCSNLCKVTFLNPSSLKNLGTHIWKGTPLKQDNINLKEEFLKEDKWLLTNEDDVDRLKVEEEEILPSNHKIDNFYYNSTAYVSSEKILKENNLRFKKVLTPKELRRMYLIRTVAVIIAIVVISAIALIINKGYGTNQENIAVEDRNLYHNQGLPSSVVLDQTPDKVTEECVIYRDRVLKRYSCSEDMLKRQIKLYEQISSTLPKEITQSVMIVPLRIQYEEGAKDYVGNMEKDVKFLYESLPQNMVHIDLFKELEPYKQRYIYYRTEPYWTSEGAYYGVSAYRKAFSGSLLDLTKYEEYLYNSMTGKLYLDNNPQINMAENIALDQIYYYLQPKSSNWEKIYKRSEDRIWNYYEEPIVSKSRGGINSFVGGSYAYGVMDGMVNNGKSILILGDKNADIAVPYLLGDYEKVVIVNNIYFREAYKENTKSEFLNLFKEYKVTDFLYVQGADRLEDNLMLGRTYSLFCEDKDRDEIMK